MSRDELKKLIDEGHEIEFNYNGKKYSITYGELNGKEQDKEKIPKPSKIESLKISKNEYVIQVMYSCS